MKSTRTKYRELRSELMRDSINILLDILTNKKKTEIEQMNLMELRNVKKSIENLMF